MADSSITPYIAGAGSLVAALAGAWIGASRALAQYKEQRAFDLRAQWYAAMCGSLHEMGGVFATVLHFYERGTSAEVALAAKKIEPLISKLGLLAAAAELYASHDGVQAVRQLNERINATGNELWALMPHIPHRTEEARMAAIKRMSEITWHTAKVLAREFRAEMNWESLPVP